MEASGLMHSIFKETITDGLYIAELVNTVTNISVRKFEVIPYE